MYYEYKGKTPVVDPSSYVAPGARLVGDVRVGKGVGIWFNAVLRADVNHIEVGDRSNIQDCAVFHADEDHPTILGKDVTVGHSAVVHACTVEDGALIGMGAIVLNGAIIGENALIGAGALVPGGKVIPPRSLVVGNPMKIIRELTDEEIDNVHKNKDLYVKLANDYLNV